MKKEYLNDHPKTRKLLKVFGFLFSIIGGTFLLIGTVTFFSGSTDLFFMNFIGMPFLFVGLVCLSYGFMGQVARYSSSQITPVVKDSTNYLLDGTKDEIIKVVEGIKGKKVRVCPSCGDKNSDEAMFCNMCGKPLTKVCQGCSTNNKPNAAFCNKCGNKL